MIYFNDYAISHVLVLLGRWRMLVLGGFFPAVALLGHAEALNYPEKGLLLLFVFLELALHLLVLLLQLLIASLVDGSSVCALAYDVPELREPSLHFLELLLTAISQLR